MAKRKAESAESLSVAAAKMGRKGGKIGGPARARVLSDAERSRIAAMGARAKAAKYGRKKK
jgi:hypothetical protein